MNRQLFCAWACTTCRWQTLAAGPPRANPVLSPPLHKALQVIARGFHKELGLRQVASGASISVPHLHILFRQHLYLGGSPAKVPEVAEA